ncbi:MAG TPA: LptF/LptG family permease [Cytophagaceae bacterium]|nr:LptF/LptG family permease [Cytophagaceae bacterium]
MNILDRYILKKFLTSFFFVVILLVAVIVVIDITERLDDFITCGASFQSVVLDYYFNFIPYIANMLSPITIFIATVFVTARLAAHTEIIAILSAGVSFRRLLFPYFIGSTMIGIGTFFLIGWVIPKANKGRVDFENRYFEGEFTYEGRNVHMKIAPETYVYLESYNSKLNIGYQFSLETIRDNKMIYKLKTDKITWDTTRHIWHMDAYSERMFDGEKEKENYKQGYGKDLKINLTPKDFGNGYMLHSTFTFPDLLDYIQELKDKGAENVNVYLVEKYERMTYPFAIIILTMIGVVVSARKSREGTGFQIAFGFILAAIYILMVIVSRNFANVGDISPMVAAWIPNVLFTLIGFQMYRNVPK